MGVHRASNGFRALIRETAKQAQEAAAEGRYGDGRTIVREFCQQYAGELDAPPTPGPRTDDLTPGQLADLIRDR